MITLAAALANGYSPNDRQRIEPCTVPSDFGALDSERRSRGGGRRITLWDATAELGELRVRPARDQRGRGQGDRHGAQDGHHARRTSRPFLTLTLGVFEQNTETMADVMATIASGGVHHTPYVVQKIVSTDGRVLLDRNNPGDRVLDGRRRRV